MRLFSLIILLLILLLGASFAIINASDVTVNYYFGNFTLPLSFLLMLTFVFGIIVGVFAMLGRLFHLKRELWSAQSKTKAQQTEPAAAKPAESSISADETTNPSS